MGTAACAALAATCDQYSFCKRVRAGSSTPAAVSPMGACVSNDPNVDYSVACKALETTCEQWSFCKRVSSLIQSSIHSAPVRRLRRHGSSDHALFQQGDIVQDTVANADEDEIEYAGEYRLGSESSLVASPSRSEL